MSERQRNNSIRARRALMAVAPGLALLGTMIAFVQLAHADNAFPESQSVLLPRDRPKAIVLATTFGLVSSDDDGATWYLSCESGPTLMLGGGMYSMGPAAADRIFATSDVGAVVSADSACTWSVAGGDLVSLPPPALPRPFDVFPDPTDPSRVFLLASDQNAANPAFYAFRSLDAGATYAGPIYTAPAGTVVTGIEASASAPGTVVMTLYDGSPVHPRLAVSVDAGATWTLKDLQPGLGNAIPMLAAVDPEDAARIYLRLVAPAGAADQYQGIAITTDGGSSWTIPLTVARGTLAGFARLSAQTLLAVGATAPPTAGDTPPPALFRSDDGGSTFTTSPLTFHPVGLAQRGGIPYVATKDVADGFALATSLDSGRTWTPRLRFREITGLKECVRASCHDACDYLAGLKLFPPAVCNPAASAAKAGGGCGCSAAAGSTAAASWALVGRLALGLLGAALIWERRRRLRTPPRSAVKEARDHLG